MKDGILKSIIAIIIFTVICGVIYTGLVTLIGQMFFKENVNGSMIKVNGKEVGSKYIGQRFESEKYFWGRPSETDYTDSRGSNKEPDSKEYQDEINKRIQKLKKSSNNNKEVPMELVTTSGSGLDPNISLISAYYQVDRIAKNTGLSVEQLNNLIKENIIYEPWIGEEMLNVLELNIKLKELILL